MGYLEVDRLWLDYYTQDLQITIGRQRVAWGTSWVWNPTDLFNPLNVLDFDYEERPATDAIRLQYYTGAVSKVDLTYKPAKELENQILAGLVSFNNWNYDFNLIAGMRFKRWLVGLSWVGDILDAGFRGEVLVSQTPNNIRYIQAGHERLQQIIYSQRRHGAPEHGQRLNDPSGIFIQSLIILLNQSLDNVLLLVELFHHLG